MTLRDRNRTWPSLLCLLLLMEAATVNSALGQYPKPTSLKRLKTVTLEVYVQQGIPLYPQPPFFRPTAQVIEEQHVQQNDGASVRPITP